MRLICTSSVASASRRWAPTPKCRPSSAGRRCHARGTAEIELLLVIPLLLTILFLAGGATSLGKARMSNAYNAENGVYTQVVSGVGFSPANDPTPPAGVGMPLLPTRYAMADEVKNVTLASGLNVPWTATLNDRAIMLDPAWTYSAWPQTGDRPAIAAWFTAYVDESHPADVVQALGLQPPGPP